MLRKKRTLLILICVSSSQLSPLPCTTLSMSPREYLAHIDGSAASASAVQGTAAQIPHVYHVFVSIAAPPHAMNQRPKIYSCQPESIWCTLMVHWPPHLLSTGTATHAPDITCVLRSCPTCVVSVGARTYARSLFPTLSRSCDLFGIATRLSKVNIAPQTAAG